MLTVAQQVCYIFTHPTGAKGLNKHIIRGDHTMKKDSPGNTGIAIDLLSGKWQLRILICLCRTKKIRFNELRRMLPGISNNMLSQCLREFEKYQIVERKQYEEIPPRVEYSLTELGEDLHPAIHLLNEWGKKVQEVNGLLCEDDTSDLCEENAEN